MKVTSFIPAILWFIVSVVLLTLPGKDLPHEDLFDIPYFDKYIHFTMFLMLTALFCYPFINLTTDNFTIKSWFVRITILVIVYGILMEFVQKFMSVGRSFDLVDIVFDALGSVAGWAIISWIYVKKIGPNRNRGRNQN